MKMPKTAPWVLGAAFAAVVILVLAWVVGISPQLDRARQADDEAEGVELQNVGLAARLETLRDQFAHLDEYKAELEAIQRQIPPTDEEPSLTREIEAATTSAGIFLVSITTEDAQLFTSAASATTSTPAPTTETGTAPAEGATEDGAESGGDAAAATPEGTTAPVAPVAPSVPGFVAIPVNVTVLGTYDAAVRFVEIAQNSFSRLFVVTSLIATGQKPSPPSGGKPEIREGDVEAVISGYVYVLQEQDAATADPAADGTADS